MWHWEKILPFLEYICERVQCLFKDKRSCRDHQVAFHRQGQSHAQSINNWIAAFAATLPHYSHTIDFAHFSGIGLFSWEKDTRHSTARLFSGGEKKIFEVLTSLRFGVLNPRPVPEIKHKRTMALGRLKTLVIW